MYSYETPKKDQKPDIYDQKQQKVDDFVNKNFLYFKEDTPIEEALKKLSKSDLTGAPVLDEQGRAVGFLSDKDCLRLATSIRYLNIEGGFVSEFMTKKVFTIPANTGIFEVIDHFTKQWFHIYPVTDENESVIGIVRRKDILKEVNRWKKTHW